MVESAVESLSEVAVHLAEEAPIRILHVDDDAGFLKSAKQILEMEGAFQVETAVSVEDAVEKIKESEFDAIVSDYVMPGRDGLEFLEELREKGSNIPFIIFTGKGREEVAIKALNLGADRYINKRGKPETVYYELAHCIRQSVGERRSSARIWRREQRLSAIFASSPDAITVSDLQGNIIDCNKAAWKLSEYPSKEELLGKSAFDLIAEKDRKRALENLQKTLEQGTTRNLQYTLLKKDGDEYTAELSATLIRDASGDPTGFVAIIRDITKRKKTEAQRKKLLHDLNERVKELRCLYQMSKLVENPDRSLAETLQETVNLLPPAWQHSDITCARIVLDGQEFKTENFTETRWKQQTNITAHGETIGTVEVHYLEQTPTLDEGPFLNEERQLIEAVAQRLGRIIERKRAEKRLRESEKKYRQLVSSLYEGVWVIDEDAYTTLVNTRMAEMLGYTQDEMLGKHLFEFMDEEGTEICKRNLKRCKRGIEEELDFEFLRKDGARVYTRIATSPLTDDRGNYTGAIAGIVDITEKKKGEEELRKSEERWQSLVKNTSDYVVIVDEKGKVEYINKAIPPHQPEQIIGKSIYDYSPTDYHNAMKKDLANVFKTGRPGSHESALKHPLGTRWFRTKTTPIKDNETVLNTILLCEDITEQKKAEEELRKSEAKYRSLVEDAAAGIITVDTLGKFTFVNEAICETIGYSEKELIGKHFADFIHPDDKNRILQIFASFLKKPEMTPDFEFRVPHKEGHIVHLQSAPTLIQHENERVGSHAIIIDITEHKKAEEELVRLSNAMKMSTEGILITDIDGTITDANEAALKMHGVHDKREIVGKNAFDTIAPESQERALSDMKEVLETGYGRGHDYHLLTKNGNKIVVEIGVTVLKDASGNPTGVVNVIRDITERKQAEEELKRSEERYRRLMEETPVAILRLNMEGEITYVNRRYEEITGYSRDEILGKSWIDLIQSQTMLSPKSMTLAAKRLRARMRGKTTGPMRLQLRRKGGRQIWIEGESKLIKKSGVPIGLQATFRGVTQRMEAENALRETLQNLETLNEKLEVLGKLTRHDARNKLSTVTMQTFLAKQTLTDNPEISKQLSEIEAACTAVERIFDFASIYEKLGMEELAYIDAEKTFAEAVMLFSDLQDIDVVNDCNGLTVLADSLLRRLFYNLIDNSLKHGEKVSQIRVCCEAGKDQLELLYEDDGIGIPKAEKEKIFKEGYGKGTGYGLYLVRKMCDVYGWSIEETGKGGKGAQFTITIPLSSEGGRVRYKFH